MATSDSENFESADEDFDEPMGADNCQKSDGDEILSTNSKFENSLEIASVVDEQTIVHHRENDPTPTLLQKDKAEIKSSTTEKDSNESSFEGNLKQKNSLDTEHQQREHEASISPGTTEAMSCQSSAPELDDIPTHSADDLSQALEEREDDAPEVLVPEEISKNPAEVGERQKSKEQERPRRERPVRTKEAKQSGVKKLGMRVAAIKPESCEEVIEKSPDQGKENMKQNPSREQVESREEETDITGVQDNLASSTFLKEDPKEGALSSVLEKLASPAEEAPSSGWGWGGWGSSLLSTATASVSSLSTQVTQGLSSVLETVEGGLGVPEPEELARQDQEAAQILQALKEPEPKVEDKTSEEEKVDEGNAEDLGWSSAPSGLFPLGQLMSGVSHLSRMVESTGSKVLSGGLDTLEVIGKKTMEVLQEGDPGFKKKRALFQPDKPVLSQALREAKDRAEEETKMIEEKQAARKVHFETLFDDYRGLIHLEALEMLSRQCEMKLQAALLSLSGSDLQDTQGRLHTVREDCILPDPDDMPDEPTANVVTDLEEAFSNLPVDVSPEKLIKVWEEVQASVQGCLKPKDEEDSSVEAPASASIHQSAISALAQLTACSVEHFHRVAELLLVCDPRQTDKEAAQLKQITLLLSSVIEQLASSFCEALNSLGDSGQPLITNVFLEASNSSSYVQDAFQLLVPVLQVGAL